MKTPPVSDHDFRNCLCSLSCTACRHGKFVALLAFSSLLAASTLRAQNTEFDVASEPTTQQSAAAGAPNLSAAATYTNNAVPGTMGDLTFNATNFYSEPEPTGYTPATGVFIASPALSIGSLNDLSTSQAITITNGNTGTQAPFTLNGGDSVSGNTADLLYVATGATLNVSNIKPNGGAVGNTVILTLAASGNFDVVGTATILVPIASGTQVAPTANPFGITKTGAGTLTLTNVGNNFTGGTTVNAGTLALSGGGGTGALRGTVTVNSGANLVLNAVDALGNTSTATSVTTLNVNGGTVDNTSTGNEGFLTSFNLTGATMSSSGGGSYNIAAGDASAPSITTKASGTTSTISGGIAIRSGNLPFNVAAGTTASHSDLTVSGVISGAGFGVAKAGAGTMMLTAANTYTGPTTVNVGSLIVTGSLAAGSAVSVSNTGTILGGAGDGTTTGVIGGAVTINNGSILSVGNRTLTTPAAIGILATGPLTLSLGSTVNFLVASGTSFSTLNASGTTSLTNAAFSVSLLNGATFTNGTRLQKVIASSVTGSTFTNTTYSVGGYTFTADYATDPGFFDLRVAAVPEPSTWVCGLIMIVLAGVFCRRKIESDRRTPLGR